MSLLTEIGDLIKTVSVLTHRQIIIILLSIVVGGQGVLIYKLITKVETLDATITTNNERYDTNITALQTKINVQEQEKFKIIQEAQEYFRARFEKLEEESKRNFREVKQTKK